MAWEDLLGPDFIPRRPRAGRPSRSFSRREVASQQVLALALVLDEVAAGVAGVDVVPAALLLIGAEAAVDEGADAGSEVRHHDTAPR